MKPGRNDLCPCGSNRKYKRCCGGAADNKAGPAAAVARQAATRQMLALGLECYKKGHWAKAREIYEQILREQPNQAEALHLLGVIACLQQNYSEGVDRMRRAAALMPQSADIQINLGNAYEKLDRREEAEGCFRRALQLGTRNGPACYNLGSLLAKSARYHEAEEILLKALEYHPDNGDILVQLGQVAAALVQIPKATAYFRQVVDSRKGTAQNHSALFFYLQYDPAQTPATQLAEHLEWDRRYGEKVNRFTSYPASMDPDRPLKIGYLSPDFRRHPMGFIVKPLLEHHDRQNFQIYCYADQTTADEQTELLRGLVDQWRETAHLDDNGLAELIRTDGIDILLDLSGHMADNRLLLFARKPVPVQASWAGYVGTTGLAAINYLIANETGIPAGTDDCYSERVYRLPDCHVTYGPPAYAPPVGPLPALVTNGVTFGCFNNLAKVNEEVIALWAKILASLPQARLLLISSQLNVKETCRRYEQLFAQHGVAGQVTLQGSLPHGELLASYHRLDIALDTFPYSGTTTTLESLWMGVPVITLPGSTYVSRQSMSILTAAGMTDLIAMSREEYLAIALDLANDLPRLAKLRSGLRERMAETVCNGPRFTRQMEAAYRNIWTRWCTGQQEAEQIRHQSKYTYEYLDLCITYRCNMHCLNCIELCNMQESTGLDYRDSDMTMGQIDNLIDQIKSLHHEHLFETVCITGGEPLLHPDIEEITRKLAELRAQGYFRNLVINSNTLLTPPRSLQPYIVNYSEPQLKKYLHNTVLLHPQDFGGKEYTFATCTHYRKNRVVLNYQGFSICCAGDAFIRLFCLEELIVERLPPSIEGFPLAEMDKVCRHCPFSNQNLDEEIMPFEKELGRPVSAIYAAEADKNRLGRSIRKRFPSVENVT